MTDDLSTRLHAALVPAGATPLEAWTRLHAESGATVLDLYELVAQQRGIAATDLSPEERFELAHTVLPEIWPGYGTTPDSIRRGDTITICDYDEQWPVRYEQWRAAIADALGDTARRIEHVGSTSVPGLAAKPIVDIQVSVDDLEDEASYVPALEATGVQLRSRDDLHRYFRPFADRPRDVHVHVCRTGSDWERDHLLFRDYLRTDARAREDYAQAKRDAARAWSDDGIAYTDAKADVILAILAHARIAEDARPQ